MARSRFEALPSLTRDGRTLIIGTTARARLLGLAALPAERAAGMALLIPDCRSVHTFGMRFELDLTFLNADWEALRRERCVPPNRVVSCRGAQMVLEVPAG